MSPFLLFLTGGSVMVRKIVMMGVMKLVVQTWSVEKICIDVTTRNVFPIIGNVTNKMTAETKATKKVVHLENVPQNSSG